MRSKGRMLAYLKKELPELCIMPICMVRAMDFYGDRERVVDAVRTRFSSREVIVRSSCSSEDTRLASNAGKFLSVLHVPAHASAALSKAIDEVFRSYGEYAPEEEVLIQPMLQDVVRAGVVFTVDLETYADYYVVNYQDGSDTEAVTSGVTNQLRTFVRYKGTPFPAEDPDMGALLEACGRIETFLEDRALDIEFAVTARHEVYILQVRPIARGEKQPYAPISLDIPLRRISRKVEKLGRPHPFLLGKRTLFGVMPDWNPAEILGLRPKRLSLSLYKELVTDSVWAHQRKNYGYRDLTMHPLMASFFGIPYIDTRITFNSFVPQSLDDGIADKLVNYYLDRLAEYPSLHDKVEFEIVFSCYYPGIPKRLRSLLAYGFNENEIKRIEFSLLSLTNPIIRPGSALLQSDLDQQAVLEEQYEKIVCSDISDIDKIYWLIEIGKAYGTLPFAGAARAAFIAVQLLDSFVCMGVMSHTERDGFLASLSTVASQMAHDTRAIHSGILSKEAFLKRYGHVRPGTYDILSPRYDEAFDLYFSQDGGAQPDEDSLPFSLSAERMAEITALLRENGLDSDGASILMFMKRAIEGREQLKFAFTKCVSEILRLVQKLGRRTGIGTEDLAYLDLSVIREMYVDLYYGSIHDVFLANIEANKQQYAFLEQLKLPALIADPRMVYEFYLLADEPNFITQKRMIGEPLADALTGTPLAGKVVFIPSADPGFDFLFGTGLEALVTKYGGANSHMAIRCAELGIPAVIGAGEQNFDTWKAASRLDIDCQKKRVMMLGK